MWSVTFTWGQYSVTRGASRRRRATLNAFIAVFFYRLLQPFSRRWGQEGRDVWPWWYDFLTRQRQR